MIGVNTSHTACSTPKILLVEDDASDAAMMRHALSKSGVSNRTEHVRDAKLWSVAALDYLSSPDTPLPDLVLLDLKLPKCDGFEVLARAS